jgi:hypothetical protein
MSLEVEELENERCPWNQSGAERGEPSRKTSRGPSADLPGDVSSRCPGVEPGQMAQTVIQGLHGSRRRPLLGTEDGRGSARSDERIPDIAKDGEGMERRTLLPDNRPDSSKGASRWNHGTSVRSGESDPEGRQSAGPSVHGCASTDTQQNPQSAFLSCRLDELAGTECGSLQGISLVQGDVSQSARLRHLQDRRSIPQQGEAGGTGFTQRTAYLKFHATRGAASA